MKNLVIRDATSIDLPILLDFEQKLIEAERPFDITLKEKPISYYNIESYIKDENIKIVVADYNGQVISSGYALKKEASDFQSHKYYGYLGFMYTVEEYRGNGINKKIMEVLKEWCLKTNLNEIRLKVYSLNKTAIQAYHKAGFKSHMLEMRLSN